MAFCLDPFALFVERAAGRFDMNVVIPWLSMDCKIGNHAAIRELLFAELTDKLLLHFCRNLIRQRKDPVTAETRIRSHLCALKAFDIIPEHPSICKLFGRVFRKKDSGRAERITVTALKIARLAIKITLDFLVRLICSGSNGGSFSACAHDGHPAKIDRHFDLLPRGKLHFPSRLPPAE